MSGGISGTPSPSRAAEAQQSGAEIEDGVQKLLERLTAEVARVVGEIEPSVAGLAGEYPAGDEHQHTQFVGSELRYKGYELSL